MRYPFSAGKALVGLALLFIAAPVLAQSQGPISESNVKSLVGRISRGMAGLGIFEVHSTGIIAACGPTVEPEGVFEIPLFVSGTLANSGEVFSNSQPKAVGSASVQDGSLFLNGSGSSAPARRSIETYTWSYERPGRADVLYSGGEVSTSVPLPTGFGTLYLKVTDSRGQESESVPVAIARVVTVSAAAPIPSPPIPSRPAAAQLRSVKVMSARQIENVRRALVLYRKGGIKEFRITSTWGVRGNLLCEPPPPWNLLTRLDVLARDIDVLGQVLVKVDPGVITYTPRLATDIRTSPDMNLPFAAINEMHRLPRGPQFRQAPPLP